MRKMRSLYHFRKAEHKNVSQSTGFEPVRAEPNGFLVHRLNHSATTAFDKRKIVIDLIQVSNYDTLSLYQL